MHEYQSKELLSQYKIATQPFRVGQTAAMVKEGAVELLKTTSKKDKEGYEWVIKAQVLAGGRGKGSFKESGLKGGVQLTTE